jgi:RNase P subunit RPR2
MRLSHNFVVVPCKHCGKKIRVWYENGEPIPFREIECPSCKKPLALDVPGRIVQAEVVESED